MRFSDAPSGIRVSPEPIRSVPVSVSDAQLLGGQVAATPEVSIEPPPAATLHELWCEFGDTVNGAKTKEEAAAKEARREAGEQESEAREAAALRLPPPPRQITALTLNFGPSCASPDLFLGSFLAAPHTESGGRMQQLGFLRFI